MAEEHPPKKVVRKVVRRAVVPQPTAEQPCPSRPKLVRKPVRKPLKAVSVQGRATLTAARSAVRRTSHLASDALERIRSWRLPPLNAVPAALIAGLVAGAVAAFSGYLAMEFFSATRGTASGGGFWGLLMVLAIGAIAFVSASRPLAKFGSPNVWATSFLGVVLALILVIVLFRDAVDGPWAWLILPSVGAMCFAGADRLLSLPTNSPD